MLQCTFRGSGRRQQGDSKQAIIISTHRTISASGFKGQIYTYNSEHSRYYTANLHPDLNKRVFKNPKSTSNISYQNKAIPTTLKSSDIGRFLIIQHPVLFRDASRARVATVILLAHDDIAFTAKHLVLDVDLVKAHVLVNLFQTRCGLGREIGISIPLVL